MSDHIVREAIEAGARTPRELARSCGAGAECRGCWPTLRELLEEEVGMRLPGSPEPVGSGRMLAR